MAITFDLAIQYKTTAHLSISTNTYCVNTSISTVKHDRWAAEKTHDYILCRCSIEVDSAKELLQAYEHLKDHFKTDLLCVKNGYHRRFKVRGSGYRDLKLLVKMGFTGDFEGACESMRS